MSNFSDFYYDSSTGCNTIHARKCIPNNEIRGIVQIAHGIAEHIERYDEFAVFLAEKGLLVVGNDHLGHGKSTGVKGHFSDTNGWNYVVEDMKLLFNQTSQEYPDVPYIMFGHSMGSFLLRNYLIKYPEDAKCAIISGTGNQPKALILSGVLLSSAIKKIKGVRYIATELNDICFGSYNNGYNNPKTDFDWLSRDEKAVEAYIDDDLCGFVCTAALYNDMMSGINFITNPLNINKMCKSTPIYFMSGSADPVGDNGKGVEKAYKLFCNAGMKDVSLRLYQEGRHEMLNEINRETVMNDILDWINSKI